MAQERPAAVLAEDLCQRAADRLAVARRVLALVDLIQTKEDDPLKQTLATEQEKILHQHIESLSEREQQIIYMYYFKEKTFKEIAEILGLTESRISQIHSDIKEVLGAKIIAQT